MNIPTNPLHEAYNAMSQGEKDAHTDLHPGVAEACVEIFEMTTGYRVNLIPRAHFGTHKRYTARLMCTEVNVPIDRAMPLEIQALHFEHYLQVLKAKHEEWQMGHELREIISLHGVTEPQAA
jgi:hypothetical protein